MARDSGAFKTKSVNPAKFRQLPGSKGDPAILLKPEPTKSEDF
jgi:hypothetical protein